MLANEEIKSLISAIGCNPDTEEFDCSHVRYHKIILMTDADVDGSHIRTLLLTFFFRYMKSIIEKGYLYIAQPPLYKVKIGKMSQYLKDDSQLRAFIFDWASSHLNFASTKKVFDEKAWKDLLNQVAIYENKIHQISDQFKLEYRHCHSLALFLEENKISDLSDIQAIIKNLQEYFKDFTISLQTLELAEGDTEIEEVDTDKNEEEVSKETDADEENEEEEIKVSKKPKKTSFEPSKNELLFQKSNLSWTLDINFFVAKEVEELSNLLKSLMFIETETWNLSEKDKNVSKKGIIELIVAISRLSKPHMSIQRYKGLGEMNPDQLWETAMDPKTRSMLQVSIQDALEADSWFSTLMGDDVIGRRKFIERNGRFVKNLDI